MRTVLVTAVVQSSSVGDRGTRQKVIARPIDDISIS